MQPAFVRGGFLFLARITLHTHATSCIDLKQSFHPMLWCSALGHTQCLLQLACSALRCLLAWVIVYHEVNKYRPQGKLCGQKKDRIIGGRIDQK